MSHQNKITIIDREVKKPQSNVLMTLADFDDTKILKMGTKTVNKKSKFGTRAENRCGFRIS